MNSNAKTFLAVGCVIGGAVLIYAGYTGYSPADALRVLVGQQAKGSKKTSSLVPGTPTPGAQVGSAPNGYEWNNGYLQSTDPSKYPEIDQNDPRYHVNPHGQRYIQMPDGDYYDNTTTHPGGAYPGVPNTPSNAATTPLPTGGTVV